MSPNSLKDALQGTQISNFYNVQLAHFFYTMELDFFFDAEYRNLLSIPGSLELYLVAF